MSRPTPLIGVILLATLALAGCGRVTAVGPLPPAASTAPRQVTASLPLDSQPVVAVGANLTGAAPLAQPGACDALAGCDINLQLVVGDLQKKKAGFLWRKLKVTGKVTNRGAGALDAEVMVRFKKNGTVVQSEYVAVAALSAGASKAFEYTSSVAADDVEVTSRAL